MATSTIALAGLEGDSHTLESDLIDGLDTRIIGRVIRNGEPGWRESTLLWNGLITKRPSLVIQPLSANDVAETVGFARDKALSLGIKGGGHNVGGTAVAENGLLLDMSAMNSVVVDPVARTADVGPGCLLGDVDRATQEHGLATPLGFVSEVGVAGLTLGGGLGYLTRRFGYTVDNLEEVDIVTADGEIRTASPDENADLFWALRGGGGNFGVVTRFRFRLHEVGPLVYGGLIAWPFDRASEVMTAYRSITKNAPPELSVWLNLLNAPPAPFVPEDRRGKPIIAMAVCYSGSLEQSHEALRPVRALGDPIFDLLSEQPYTQVQSYLDDSEPKGAHYYWRTEFLGGLNEELLATMREVFAGSPMPLTQIGVLHLGGALNERDWDDGAVGNRDAKYAVGVLGMWEPDPANQDAYRRWVRNAGDRIHPFSTGATYINFQTSDEGDERVRASYGPNFERLVAIKQKYDPDNLFRSNRNIR